MPTLPWFQDLYAAFNERRVDDVLARFAADVHWPKAFEGGSVVGHAEVGDYWRRQWSEIDPAVTPVAVADVEPGVVDVTVDQVVKDLDGAVVAEATVVHRYAFDDAGLVTSMTLPS